MTDSPPAQEATSIVSKFQQPFDLLSKGWVLLLAAIYGTGYLVVSIYHASLGLNEINALRPKVAAAGLLFLVLTSCAVLLAFHVFNFVKSDRDMSTTQKLIIAGMMLYCFDIAGALGVSLLMDYDNNQPLNSIVSTLWASGVLVALAAVGGRNYRQVQLWKAHWLFQLACILVTASLLVMSMPRHGQFGCRQFALYLATVQFAAASLSNVNPLLATSRFNIYTTTIVTMLLPFITFSLWVYPHTHAAFGGGEPTAAEMSLVPSLVPKISVRIIDETEAGYYLIESTDTRVSFIPRSRVTQVIFNKPSGSF